MAVAVERRSIGLKGHRVRGGVKDSRSVERELRVGWLVGPHAAQGCAGQEGRLAGGGAWCT